jgi:uncharacterized protein (TIGR01777 family)
VVILTRRRPVPAAFPRHVYWDGKSGGAWTEELNGADAVVNVTGESIAARPWTAQRKRTLASSRVEPTAALVAAIELATTRPPLLINASGVAYYGDTGDQEVAEEAPPGLDFLARLVVEWEATARRAQGLGTRVVLMRQGIVLSSDGGVLPLLSLPFRLFLGGIIGSGNQWIPWVHLDDVIGLYRFAINHADATGPINVTAPEAATNRELSAALARTLGRPSWVPVPAAGMRLLLREMADVVLTGQRVVPAAAQRLGYTFREPTLSHALMRELG